MLHYFVWNIKTYWDKKLLISNDFWLEIIYNWNRIKWEFFLFPFFDENLNTYSYLAFDSFEQKNIFLGLYKISWIWLKVSYNISYIPKEELKSAIDNFDVKYFQLIPWVWPKTAKRLLIELKWKFTEKDISKLNIDEKLYKDIVKTLKGLWYDTWKLKSLLEKCPIKLEKNNTWDIIKWLLKSL